MKGNHLNSIHFRGQAPTNDVTIDGNEISGAANDCIHIHDGAAHPTRVLIENNEIHDCGAIFPASDLYHAIYDQVPDVVVKFILISGMLRPQSVFAPAVLLTEMSSRG